VTDSSDSQGELRNRNHGTRMMCPDAVHIPFILSPCKQDEDYCTVQYSIPVTHLVPYTLSRGSYFSRDHLVWVRCQDPVASTAFLARFQDYLAGDKS
jgi:hypothetical protein